MSSGPAGPGAGQGEGGGQREAPAVVRDAVAGDLAHLARLEARIFAGEAWDEASLRTELTGPGRRLLAVGAVGRPTAYAATMVAGDVADLLRVGVDPAHRRAGLGRLLLGAVVAHARAAGAERLLLEVAATNAPALALYAAAGMVEIDRRPRYYRDGADALVLALALD